MACCLVSSSKRHGEYKIPTTAGHDSKSARQAGHVASFSSDQKKRIVRAMCFWRRRAVESKVIEQPRMRLEREADFGYVPLFFLFPPTHDIDFPCAVALLAVQHESRRPLKRSGWNSKILDDEPMSCGAFLPSKFHRHQGHVAPAAIREELKKK